MKEWGTSGESACLSNRPFTACSVWDSSSKACGERAEVIGTPLDLSKACYGHSKKTTALAAHQPSAILLHNGSVEELR